MHDPPNPTSIMFTLGQIDQNVKTLLEANEDLTKIIAKNDARITVLERWKSQVMTLVGVVAACVPIAGVAAHETLSRLWR